MATPEGIVSMEAPHPPGRFSPMHYKPSTLLINVSPDSFQSKEANDAFSKYIQDAIPTGKAHLAEALKRYSSKLWWINADI